MTRAATLDALVDDIDRALEALRSARKILDELRRTPEERRSRLQISPTGRRVRDLRFSGMTAAEAAVALGVSEEHVRRLLRRGELVGVSYGGRIGWRLPRDYVLDLAAKITESQESHEEARQRLIPGSRPPGRPRKQRANAQRPRT